MPAGNQATQIIFLVVIVGAFYFLLIRPQQQQQKRQQAMVSSLEAGAEIMTIGGIYATIVDVEDDRVRVRVADGSEFEIAKRAVASVVAASEDDDSGDAVGDLDEADDIADLDKADHTDPADEPADGEQPAGASSDVSKDSATDA
jgi:preprotein translocase subunit YajC